MPPGSAGEMPFVNPAYAAPGAEAARRADVAEPVRDHFYGLVF